MDQFSKTICGFLGCHPRFVWCDKHTCVLQPDVLIIYHQLKHSCVSPVSWSIKSKGYDCIVLQQQLSTALMIWFCNKESSAQVISAWQNRQMFCFLKNDKFLEIQSLTEARETWLIVFINAVTQTNMYNKALLLRKAASRGDWKRGGEVFNFFLPAVTVFPPAGL